jgi:hypothetical protein
VSEKASDLPEPLATARSQSFFVAFSLSVALKIRTVRPDVRHVRHGAFLPWRRWTVTSCLSLVATRPQMLTVSS